MNKYSQSIATKSLIVPSKARSLAVEIVGCSIIGIVLGVMLALAI